MSVLAALAAYLIGSLSFAVIVSRAFGLSDPRTYGSGNPGATNVLRSGSKAAAIVTLLLDAFKGWLPVMLVKWFGPAYGLGEGTQALAGLAAFLGHLYPVFFGFKGGKGVSSTCGVMLMTFWWQALICYVITIALIAITKFVSLGSLALVVLFGILVTATNWGNWLVIAWVWVIAGLCIYRHHANIGRLIHGTERKIGQKA